MKHRGAGPCKCGRDRFYAERGIRVCKKWHAFEEFRAWAIANGYRSGCSVARLYKDRDYKPSNCRVIRNGATRPFQARMSRP